MNIKHKLMALVIFFLLPVSIFGQNSLLKIEDCYNGKYYPSRKYDMQWLPNAYKISYTNNGKIWIQDVFSLKIDSSLKVEDINKGFRDGKVGLKKLPTIHWVSETEFYFENENNLYSYDIVTQTTLLRRKLGPHGAIEIHERTMNTAVIADDNIHVISPAGRSQVTFDGGNGIVYGQAVHRNEFGINKGLFWSNDGYKLAFYRMDEKAVTNINELNIKDLPASKRSFKYPFAGDSSHTVTVGIYNVLTDKVYYIQTKLAYDDYLTNISWDLMDEHIYIAELNRDQNKMTLNAYDASTGLLDKTLFTEENAKYVEPENPPLFLANEDGFLWQSEKDGYNHVYWYNKKGKECQITKGNWVVTKVLGFDEGGKGIYFESTQESPLERQVHYAPLKKDNTYFKQITLGKGTHSVVFNSNSTLFLDDFTSTKVPRAYNVFKSDGTLINSLYNAPNPTENFDLGRLDIHPIIKDGVALYTRTYYPSNFDRNVKYPVIIYVYGGPHAQMITESWIGGGNLWFYFMAQNGYIVHTIDNRGSANRGFDFESVIHRQLGNAEMEDQLFGLDQLLKQPYVDASRVGVHGWSFGGFMTTSLMSRYPGRFKVGVAGGPVIDWRMYEIMYGERYMDRPQQNPEGYKTANLLTHVNNLDGRLLMIHGMDDNVVVWQHSLNYLNAQIKTGKDNLDYFFYPGHEHNVMGRDRTHLYKKVSQYFFDHL